MMDKREELLRKAMPVHYARKDKRIAQKRIARKRKMNRTIHNEILRKTIRNLNSASKARFNDYFLYPDKNLREIINTYLITLINELVKGKEVSIPKLGKLRIAVRDALPKGDYATLGKQGKYDARMHAIAVDSLKKAAKKAHDLGESEKMWTKESKKYRKRSPKKHGKQRR